MEQNLPSHLIAAQQTILFLKNTERHPHASQSNETREKSKLSAASRGCVTRRKSCTPSGTRHCQCQGCHRLASGRITAYIPLPTNSFLQLTIRFQPDSNQRVFKIHCIHIYIISLRKIKATTPSENKFHSLCSNSSNQRALTL